MSRHAKEFPVVDVNPYSSCKGRLVARPVGMGIHYTATGIQFRNKIISIEKKTWSF